MMFFFVREKCPLSSVYTVQLIKTTPAGSSLPAVAEWCYYGSIIRTTKSSACDDQSVTWRTDLYFDGRRRLAAAGAHQHDVRCFSQSIIFTFTIDQHGHPTNWNWLTLCCKVTSSRLVCV